MDNTSILLYFGAFLLVAAAGLFVAFGGAAGGVRTFVIAIVAALFYCVGFWLWYDRPKLKQAALAFIGIGIVLAPLAGLAAYSYVFRESGAAVWFVTSAVCLALYIHAVSAIKHPLLEYVLIGTFVSLFESSIAVLRLPVYYYGWGLAAVGIVLQVLQLRRASLVSQTSSAWSANVLLPVALFVSLNMTPQHGTLQLAVALLLAAAYYGLVGWQSVDRARVQALIAAESLLLASAGFFGYGLRHESSDAALTLLGFAVPQVVWLWYRARSDMTLYMGTVLLGGLGVAVVLAQPSAPVLFASLLALSAAGIFVWWKQQRDSGYVIAVAAANIAMLVAAARLWVSSDAAITSAGLLWVVGMLQVAVFYLVRSHALATTAWRGWFRGMLAGTLALGFFTVFASNGAVLSMPVLLVVYTALSALLFLPLIVWDTGQLWITLAGVAPALPLLFLVTEYDVFHRPGLYAGVAVGALVWNLALSMWQRREQTRAVAAVLALLLPHSVAALVPSVRGAVFYTGAYTFVMAGLLIGRYVALRRNTSLPTNRSGLSYAIGAAAAAVLALCIVPFAHDRLLAATTAFSVALAVYIAGRYIEKLPVIMSLLPAVVQVGLWSTYVSGQLVLFSALSALVAALGYYVYATSPKQGIGSEAYYIQQGSLVMSYVPVAVYFGAVNTGTLVWTLPWAVVLAALTTLHAMWRDRQSVRETVGGFVTLAVMLTLSYYGLRNVQVYAHVLALLFAVYAYWRWHRGEQVESDKYIIATLATVTVPLVLQALSGVAGDLYGWWLLIEQVTIMLLGMVLRKKLMVRWGLYVALGAVLYQLRNLGWAALAVLAAFLIGLAVFRLQRSDRTEPPAPPTS
jgi:hypothetical protein